MSLSWESTPALLSTTQLLLTLKCYHKDVILGLFHLSADRQNKQAYGHNMADWPHISLFNPHVNPAPVPSLTGHSGTGSTSPRVSFVGGRVGQASHLLFCPLFPIVLPTETGSVEVTGQGPGGGEPWLHAFLLSLVGNLVIFCKCPIYRSLPLHL